MAQPGYAAYQNMMLTAVPPLKAIVMLYDGAIVRTKAAGEAARSGDYLKQFNEVRRAADIFNGLNRCLNMEVGGTVAISLRELYGSLVKALMRSVGDPQAVLCCEKIADAIRVTRDAWATISEYEMFQPKASAEAEASPSYDTEG
jgi:flagellar protein FliS